MSATARKLRMIMVKAPNDHVIGEFDSIEEPCRTHRGTTVMATQLACNIAGAVGVPAMVFNSAGRQVWTGKLMLTAGGKIIDRNPANAQNAQP